MAVREGKKLLGEKEAAGLSFEALWDHTLQLAALTLEGTVEEIERAAGSRWCRVPASAGARNFRGRRQLPLLVLDVGAS